jgi:protein-glutamine gamma-glutamyltransferase
VRRTALLLALPALAAVVAVLRLESPAAVEAGAATAALALAPAFVRPWWGRALAAVGAALLAAWIAFGPAPWDLLPGRDAEWVDPLAGRVDRGLLDFADQLVPFDPRERPEMHGLVLAGLFLLLLAVGLAVASRKILLAAGILVAGAGWAATMVEGRGEIAVGALVLGAALWLIVLARSPAPRGAAAGLVAALAVVALAAGASTSGAVSGAGVLDWRSWKLYAGVGDRVGVRYVWDADYSGIEFPEKATPVLRIRAPRRALYWRASTLDTFTDDRWLENLYPVALGPPGSRVTHDPFLPSRSSERRRWLRQEVRVEALQDDHVVAAATPMRIEGTELGRLFYLEGGVARVTRGLRRGQQYSVVSFVPSPTPAQLRRARPVYPGQAVRYVGLDRTSLPFYGEPGRESVVDRLFRERHYQRFWSYQPLWRAARRLAEAADSPYAATLAIERWLRADGGFRYEEQPPQARGTPPLADFVERSRAGYCQHFAGTMALMLRFLGIPARVAVGFTAGTWEDGVWTVTDHDAHAWVEAWFAGWGWLPFDPTPGRGTITASYTLASDSADAIRELGGNARILQPDGGAVGPGGVPIGPEADSERGSGWMLALPLALVAALVAMLGLAKLVRRRARYLTNDPRRLASAARAELADWLRDQGVTVRPGASVRELAGTVESRLGVSARAFATAFARARYGPPEGAVEAVADARRELRLVLRALRSQLSPRRRLRGYLALRSLRPDIDSAGSIGR